MDLDIILSADFSQSFDFAKPASTDSRRQISGRAEKCNLGRRDAAKSKNAAADVFARQAKKQPGRKRQVVHGNDKPAGFMLEQLLPAIGVIFNKRKTEIRQKSPVEKTLENGRHARPPTGINHHDMFGPLEVFLNIDQVGFELLNFFIAIVKNRVEIQFADINPPHFVAGRARAGFVAVGQSAAKRGFVGMSQQN